MKESSDTKVLVETSNAVKILKGIIISCIITLILLFVFSILLTYTDLGENTIGPVIIGITGISILARKFNDNKFHKKKRYNKWWNNRAIIYIVHIFSIKCNW